jgi:hypothetical protein
MGPSREIVRVNKTATTERSISLLIALGLLGASLAACKPTPGATCNGSGGESCTGPNTALACHDGKWEEMTCRGPSACTTTNGSSVCDQTSTEIGEVCNLPDDFACTADKKTMVQCTKNHWAVAEACLGERACSVDKGTSPSRPPVVTCDNSIADIASACREEHDYACSLDKKAALECQRGQFAQMRLCKGPKGCRVSGAKDQGTKIDCDDSLAVTGDLCDQENHFTCAADERSILVCRGKKFEVEEKCKAKEKCQIMTPPNAKEPKAGCS